jgi:hypothetical protein
MGALDCRRQPPFQGGADIIVGIDDRDERRCIAGVLLPFPAAAFEESTPKPGGWVGRESPGR